MLLLSHSRHPTAESLQFTVRRYAARYMRSSCVRP